jgi:hypothetical protein
MQALSIYKNLKCRMSIDPPQADIIKPAARLRPIGDYAPVGRSYGSERNVIDF